MAFGDRKLDNLVAVGSVSAHAARLWFRAERPDRYVVEVKGSTGAVHGHVELEVATDNQTDNTAVVAYPPPGTPALLALTRYSFTVKSADQTVFVGAGRFETAPSGNADTPAIFSVGVMSCHQPFDDAGALADANMTLLNGLPAVYAKADIKILLAAGDQIYADSPGEVSLLNPHYLQKRWPGRGELGSWTPDQIRGAYQERYRICWNQPPWLKLMSSCANYAILDDHEAFDDWGSSAATQTPPYLKVAEAARHAYMDYQGSRQLAWQGGGPVLPPSLDYGFRYGTVATFVFDLRSERTVGPPARVVSPAQIARFSAFLSANQDAHVLFVMTSVPLVHIPEWLTTIGQGIFGSKVDFPDHWSAPQNRADRDAILNVIEAHLSAHPKQRLIVVGGDVHIGCAFVLHFVGGKKPLFYELTTSAVTNRAKDGFNVDASLLGPQTFELAPRMANGRLDVSLLPAAQGTARRNPIGGLNAGLIECKRNGDETNVRLKLIGYDQSHNIQEEFVSGWL